jgi:hypothetical protein
MYLNDVSKSVQVQLNTLRDGSATANNALYANSASVAANIGSIPAARVPDLNATNAFTGVEPLRLAVPAIVSWYSGATRYGYVQITASQMIIAMEQALALHLQTNGINRVTINADGTLTIPGLITGTITTAQTATTATSATTATTATTATSASTATFANTCTSASSAATLAGLVPDESPNGSTIAQRTSNGYLHGSRFHQSTSEESISVAWVLSGTSGDGYTARNSIAAIGPLMEARNITGRTGTAKTLSTSTPSGGSNGDVWYRY